MKVFVVVWGEDNEGGNVEGVFMTREGAVKAALAVRTWGYADRSWGNPEEGVDEGVPYIRWSAGIDWVTVEEHEVSE